VCCLSMRRAPPLLDDRTWGNSTIMAEPKKAKPKASTPATARQAPAKAEPKVKAKAAQPAAKTKAAPKPQGKAKAGGSAKHATSSPDIYTDPPLRGRLKDEITAGDKGGKPGQWSARKAQLLAHEYEKAGGDYKNGKKKKTDAQQHLDSWTKEDWKTDDGKPADREGGTTRYLPAEAWDQLTPEQKKATNVKKQAGSKQGKQFVGNTDDTKTARKTATKSETDAGPKSKAKPKVKPKAKAAPKAEAEPKLKTRKKAST